MANTKIRIFKKGQYINTVKTCNVPRIGEFIQLADMQIQVVKTVAYDYTQVDTWDHVTVGIEDVKING